MLNFTNLFSSEVKLLDRAVRVASKDFNALQANIRKGAPLLKAQSDANDDLLRFNEDNGDVRLDQNVAERHNHKCAKSLLIWTFLFESILSYKGTQYFLEHFTGISFWFVVIPVALFLAFVVITMSIRLNHFAKKQKEENISIHKFLLAVSYLLILIIPASNILEGFEAGDSIESLLLNFFIVLITVLLHAWLITMSKIFMTAEVAHKAAGIRAEKEKAVANAGKYLQNFSLKEFTPARDKFAESAKSVVVSYSRLSQTDADAAKLALTRCDNFLIWAFNMVMMHNMLPLHTDANGSVQRTPEPFTPEQQSIADVWARFSSASLGGMSFGENGVQQYRAVAGDGKRLDEEPAAEGEEEHARSKGRTVGGAEDAGHAQQEAGGSNEAEKWL